MRNIKRRGEIVEIAFLHTVANMGFAVTKPYGDSEPYDFIVDSGQSALEGAGEVLPIQKRVDVLGGRPSPVAHYTSTRAIHSEQIDILAVYIIPVDAWYIIPVNAFSPSTYLAFLPHLPVAAGKYEQFRGAWYLMACRRKGEPRDAIVTSTACSYSRSSDMRCVGCEEK